MTSHLYYSCMHLHNYFFLCQIEYHILFYFFAITNIIKYGQFFIIKEILKCHKLVLALKKGAIQKVDQANILWRIKVVNVIFHIFYSSNSIMKTRFWHFNISSRVVKVYNRIFYRNCRLELHGRYWKIVCKANNTRRYQTSQLSKYGRTL